MLQELLMSERVAEDCECTTSEQVRAVLDIVNTALIRQQSTHVHLPEETTVRNRLTKIG